MSEELSDLLKIRREKLDDLRNKGINPFPYRFERNITAKEVLDKYGNVEDESIQDANGRVSSRNLRESILDRHLDSAVL